MGLTLRPRWTTKPAFFFGRFVSRLAQYRGLPVPQMRHLPDQTPLISIRSKSFDLRIRDALVTRMGSGGSGEVFRPGWGHTPTVPSSYVWSIFDPYPCRLRHQTITLIDDAPQVDGLDSDTAASAGVPHPLWIVPAGDRPVDPAVRLTSAATLGGGARLSGRATDRLASQITTPVLWKVPSVDEGAPSRVRYRYQITEGGKVINEEELTGAWCGPTWPGLSVSRSQPIRR